jgi:hypothetical protein
MQNKYEIHIGVNLYFIYSLIVSIFALLIAGAAIYVSVRLSKPPEPKDLQTKATNVDSLSYHQKSLKDSSKLHTKP